MSPRQIEDRIHALTAGRPVRVCNAERTFDIVPRHGLGVSSYAVRPVGSKKVVTPYRLLSRGELYNWLAHLKVDTKIRKVCLR